MALPQLGQNLGDGFAWITPQPRQTREGAEGGGGGGSGCWVIWGGGIEAKGAEGWFLIRPLTKRTIATMRKTRPRMPRTAISAVVELHRGRPVALEAN